MDLRGGVGGVRGKSLGCLGGALVELGGADVLVEDRFVGRLGKWMGMVAGYCGRVPGGGRGWIGVGQPKQQRTRSNNKMKQPQRKNWVVAGGGGGVGGAVGIEGY